MKKQKHRQSDHWLKYLKNLYRIIHWQYLKIISRGWVDRNITIRPSDITLGQTPESQFPPRKFLGGNQDGDWDLKVLRVDEHLLFKSYVQHFIEGKSWQHTPFYKKALDTINQGKAFRGSYTNPDELRYRFDKCDALYKSISQHGYKSNHQLYSEGSIDNILLLMDEVTVNIGRNGDIILNDGWHRFATVRMLGIEEIPARICAVHSEATQFPEIK